MKWIIVINRQFIIKKKVVDQEITQPQGQKGHENSAESIKPVQIVTMVVAVIIFDP